MSSILGKELPCKWGAFAVVGGLEYEYALLSCFYFHRLGSLGHRWLRRPRTCLYRPAAGGGCQSVPCARSVSDPWHRPGACPRRHRDRYPTPARGAASGPPPATAWAGLRLDGRILELEWGRLGLGARSLDSPALSRGDLVWRPLGLSGWTLLLGARPLALRGPPLE